MTELQALTPTLVYRSCPRACMARDRCDVDLLFRLRAPNLRDRTYLSKPGDRALRQLLHAEGR